MFYVDRKIIDNLFQGKQKMIQQGIKKMYYKKNIFVHFFLLYG